MSIVTISPTFQIVIPSPIRKVLGIVPDQKMQAFTYENRIELVLLVTLQSARGFLKGIHTAVHRENDRI